MLSSRPICAAISLFLPLIFASACSGGSEESFTETVRKAAIEDAFTGPALWQVSDEDTTVYLFGTVHTLRPDTRWQTPLIDQALKDADAVYFEADTSSAKAQNDISQTVTELGLFIDGQTLSDILPAEAATEIEETAALLGVELQAFDNFKPWLASSALSDLHLDARGFDSALGVEKIVAAEIEARATPVRFLETGAYQLGLLASVPEAEQIAMLVQTAEQIEDEPDFLDNLIVDWASGDVEALAASIANDDVFGSGEIYNLMLRTRNANWASKIDTLLEEEAGTFFIAVGAAHLAGPDSVQNILAAKGITATRENPQKPAPQP